MAPRPHARRKRANTATVTATMKATGRNATRSSATLRKSNPSPIVVPPPTKTAFLRRSSRIAANMTPRTPPTKPLLPPTSPTTTDDLYVPTTPSSGSTTTLTSASDSSMPSPVEILHSKRIPRWRDRNDGWYEEGSTDSDDESYCYSDQGQEGEGAEGGIVPPRRKGRPPKKKQRRNSTIAGKKGALKTNGKSKESSGVAAARKKSVSFGDPLDDDGIREPSPSLPTSTLRRSRRTTPTRAAAVSQSDRHAPPKFSGLLTPSSPSPPDKARSSSSASYAADDERDSTSNSNKSRPTSSTKPKSVPHPFTASSLARRRSSFLFPTSRGGGPSAIPPTLRRKHFPAPAPISSSATPSISSGIYAADDERTSSSSRPNSRPSSTSSGGGGNAGSSAPTPAPTNLSTRAKNALRSILPTGDADANANANANTERHDYCRLKRIGRDSLDGLKEQVQIAQMTESKGEEEERVGEGSRTAAPTTAEKGKKRKRGRPAQTSAATTRETLNSTSTPPSLPPPPSPHTLTPPHPDSDPQTTSPSPRPTPPPTSTSTSTSTPLPSPLPLLATLPIPHPLSPTSASQHFKTLTLAIQSLSLTYCSCSTTTTSSSPPPPSSRFNNLSLSHLSTHAPELLAYTAYLASGSQYGWHNLFASAGRRTFLFQALIARALHEHVFAPACFGVSREEGEFLDGHDVAALGRDEDTFFRSVKRAERIREGVLGASRFGLPAEFMEEVEGLSGRVGKLVEPLLAPSVKVKAKAMGERKVEGEDVSVERFLRELKQIVSFAGRLAISLRVSALHEDSRCRGAWFEFIFPNKEDWFNEGVMKCVNTAFVKRTEHHAWVGNESRNARTGAIMGTDMEVSQWDPPRVSPSSRKRVKIVGWPGVMYHVPGKPGTENGRSRYRNVQELLEKEGYSSRLVCKAHVWVENTPEAFRYYAPSEKYIVSDNLKRPFGRKETLRTVIDREKEVERIKKMIANPFYYKNIGVWAKPLMKSAVLAAVAGGVAYYSSETTRQAIDSTLHAVLGSPRVLKSAGKVAWKGTTMAPRLLVGRTSQAINTVLKNAVKRGEEMKTQTKYVLRPGLGRRVKSLAREEYENVKDSVNSAGANFRLGFSPGKATGEEAHEKLLRELEQQKKNAAAARSGFWNRLTFGFDRPPKPAHSTNPPSSATGVARETGAGVVTTATTSSGSTSTSNSPSGGPRVLPSTLRKSLAGLGLPFYSSGSSGGGGATGTGTANPNPQASHTRPQSQPRTRRERSRRKVNSTTTRMRGESSAAPSAGGRGTGPGPGTGTPNPSPSTGTSTWKTAS